MSERFDKYGKIKKAWKFFCAIKDIIILALTTMTCKAVLDKCLKTTSNYPNDFRIQLRGGLLNYTKTSFDLTQQNILN